MVSQDEVGRRKKRAVSDDLFRSLSFVSPQSQPAISLKQPLDIALCEQAHM